MKSALYLLAVTTFCASAQAQSSEAPLEGISELIGQSQDGLPGCALVRNWYIDDRPGVPPFLVLGVNENRKAADLRDGAKLFYFRSESAPVIKQTESASRLETYTRLIARGWYLPNNDVEEMRIIQDTRSGRITSLTLARLGPQGELLESAECK
jgi:hypothetical protein